MFHQEELENVVVPILSLTSKPQNETWHFGAQPWGI
jgi:hypothetical protein